MRFRYTILYVADLQATLGFYERAFGLKPRLVHDMGYAELDTGATVLAFMAQDALRSMGKTPGAPSQAMPAFEIAFEVDDVQAAFDTAVAGGATPVTAPKDMPWGQTISYVADPDGFLVEICSVVVHP